MSSEKGKGFLKAFVLGIVILKDRVHGYEIFKELKELATMSKYRWNPSLGTIYRLLNEMVDEGLIRRTEVTIGRKSIVYYEPTSKGIDEFKEISKLFLTKTYLSLQLLMQIVERLKVVGIDTREIEVILEKIRNIMRIQNIRNSRD